MIKTYQPTLQEEIDRKTVDAVESILNRLHIYMITTSEAHFALETLYDSVSGLISKDVTEMLWQVLTKLDRSFDDRYLHVLLIKKSLLAELRWDLDKQTVTLKMGPLESGWKKIKKMVFTVEEHISPGVHAHNAYLDMYKKLVTEHGFTVVIDQEVL